MRSSNLPERSASSVNAFCLVLLRMGFSLLRLVAKCTVRSYRTFSPLPVLPVASLLRSAVLACLVVLCVLSAARRLA